MTPISRLSYFALAVLYTTTAICILSVHEPLLISLTRGLAFGLLVLEAINYVARAIKDKP